MSRYLIILLALGALASCGDKTADGRDNPFQEPTDNSGTDTGGGDTDGGDQGGPIDSDRTLPPGTPNPVPDNSLYRSEAEDGAGNGLARKLTYHKENDTFSVDNLPFDGNNVYSRAKPVGTLKNQFNVYQNAPTTKDPQTGETIPQFRNKAIYAISRSGETEMAIVRSGSYARYGFGGFAYQRNGSVVLPQSGDAKWTGDYAALRDFDGKGGIEYVEGDASVAIDFDDFDKSGTVRGSVSNRRIFDTAGNDITDTFLTALSTENDTSYSRMPTLGIVVTNNALDANGEMTGVIQSDIATAQGSTTFEAGKYYGVIAGDKADEIAGIVVVTSDDPRFEGVTARETGGFIVNRKP